MPKNVQIQRNYSINNNQKYIRKDNYRLTVATGANATNLFGGEMTTNFDRRSPSFNTNNDFEHSVDVVLHSSSLHSNLGAPQQTNNNRSFNSREKNTSCNEIGIEREKEVLVKGYPPNFNKFQIASLFSDFRPLNVQYMESGESIVQFVNKFHAVQVIEKYNGRKYEDEGFTLQVRSAAKEDPTKQIGAVKTKLASLLLMITTAKAVGKENVTTTSEEDKEGW